MLVLLVTCSFAQVTLVQQRVAGGSQSDILASSLQTKDGGLIAGGSSSSGISGEKHRLRKVEPITGL